MLWFSRWSAQRGVVQKDIYNPTYTYTRNLNIQAVSGCVCVNLNSKPHSFKINNSLTIVNSCFIVSSSMWWQCFVTKPYTGVSEILQCLSSGRSDSWSDWLTDWLRGLEPFLEAGSRSACQQITRLLWNSKVPYRVYNSPSLDLILHQLNQSTILRHICSGFILILSSLR